MSTTGSPHPKPNPWLLAAAGLNAAAALLHLGCIAFGPPWYRFLGAGEGMARLAEAGSARPAVITLFIASVLLIWSGYALSGAGAIRRLPWLRTVLLAITAIYLVGGLAGLSLTLSDHALGRSATFWALSSVICLGFGLVHAIGVRSAWPRLVSR